MGSKGMNAALKDFAKKNIQIVSQICLLFLWSEHLNCYRNMDSMLK